MKKDTLQTLMESSFKYKSKKIHRYLYVERIWKKKKF